MPLGAAGSFQVMCTVFSVTSYLMGRGMSSALSAENKVASLQVSEKSLVRSG